MKKGNGMMEGVVILIVLIVIILVTSIKASDSTNRPQNSSGSLSPSGVNTATSDSLYARDISLGTGNAIYSYQSYEEYITIDNRGRNPIDITGWQLRNGKDERAYNVSGTLKYFPADTATIGQATLFISPGNINAFQNIVLQSGETAIVTTGTIGSQSPYKIVSFKENICSGYLEDLPEYKFTPPLRRYCPRPAEELGVNALDTDCRKFIERMSSCRTPEFDTRDRDGNICYNCVDGKPLSSSCVAFIKSHFNYNSCIAYHRNDQNFSGKTWRIFLGQGWEMWARDYETIKLFDQFGRLVDSRSY